MREVSYENKSGIAQVCAQAGYQVTMRDIEQRFIDGGMNTIKKNLSRNVHKEKMTQNEMDAILGRLKPTLDLIRGCRQC